MVGVVLVDVSVNVSVGRGVRGETASRWNGSFGGSRGCCGLASVVMMEVIVGVDVLVDVGSGVRG
jgi:hypothetical protein